MKNQHTCIFIAIRDPVIKRGVLTHHIFVSVPCQDLDFQRHMSWSFCFQCFTDIGGIDDHHCLNFLIFAFVVSISPLGF